MSQSSIIGLAGLLLLTACNSSGTSQPSTSDLVATPLDFTFDTLPASSQAAVTTLRQSSARTVGTGSGVYAASTRDVIIDGTAYDVALDAGPQFAYVKTIGETTPQSDRFVVLQGQPPSGAATYTGQAVLSVNDTDQAVAFLDGTAGASISVNLAGGQSTGQFVMTNGLRIPALGPPTLVSGGQLDLTIDTDNSAQFTLSGFPGVSFTNSSGAAQGIIIFGGPNAEELAGTAIGQDSNTAVAVDFRAQR